MLKSKKIGFIGAGNMGGAIVKCLIASQAVPPEHIFVTDVDTNKAREIAPSDVQVIGDALSLAQLVDIVVIAVKPQVMPLVLVSLKGCTAPLYVSIAAGVPINTIKATLGAQARVIRVMPNTPALIGEGMSVLCGENPATADDVAMVRELFASVGLVEQLPESCFDSVTAVSGSSPAYVYMMIEAMADAAVAGGIPRSVAYTLAAQAVAGSAKMVLETNTHPGQLKDNVCSPGGTTIAAVASLERNSFRSAIIDAMDVCAKRSKELGK